MLESGLKILKESNHEIAKVRIFPGVVRSVILNYFEYITKLKAEIIIEKISVKNNESINR